MQRDFNPWDSVITRPDDPALIFRKQYPNDWHAEAEKSEGRKDDSGKAPLSLIPQPALLRMAEVLSYGRDKYEAHNWRKGMNWSRVADAALRHLTAWSDGQDNDPESGLSHLGHCLCCLAFLSTYQAEGLGKDDRYHV